jgi:hypothetical protein
MMAKPAIVLMTSVGLGVLLSACSSGAATTPPAPDAATSTSASSPPQTSVTASSSTSAAVVKVDPVDKAFKAKVDTWCLAWLADANKHPPPFYMGNPTALTAAQLPQAGAWLDSLAVNHELTESASKLGAPAQATESWSTLLSDFKAFQEHQTAAITAAKSSDHSAWTSRATGADSAREVILSDLTRAGFPFSDPCQVVFSRGSFHGG